MASYDDSDSEKLPDPFQVGEDELDDDPPTPVVRLNPERTYSMSSVRMDGQNEVPISYDEEDEDGEDEEEEEEEYEEEEGEE